MGNTESLPKERSRILVEQNGWSTAYADAYLEGEYHRRRGKPLGAYVMVGIDEYSLGFRAGYFGRRSLGANQAHTASPRELQPDIVQSK